MVEGKNDFYVMSYMQFLLMDKKLHLLPGTSSSNLETPIRLYSAWGRQFLVLLDSDKEGKTQKTRYENMFETILDNRIFTLSDIDASWVNGEMEWLFTDEDKLMIQKTAYPNDQIINKTHFNRAVQELLLTKRKVPISIKTTTNFQNLFNFIRNKLAENDGV